MHLVSHQSQLCRFSISVTSCLLPFPFPSSTKAALLFVWVKLCSLERVLYWRLRCNQKLLEMVCGWNSSFVLSSMNCWTITDATERRILMANPTAPYVGPAAVLVCTWMSLVSPCSLWQSVLRGLPDWSRTPCSVALISLLFTFCFGFLCNKKKKLLKSC